MKTFLSVIFLTVVLMSCERNYYYYETQPIIYYAEPNPSIPRDGLVSEYLFEPSDNNETEFVFIACDKNSTPYIPGTSNLLYVNGKIGNCINFNGKTELVCSNSKFQKTFDNTNSYTISVWFSSTHAEYDNGFGCIFACDGFNNYPYKRLWITISNQGNIGFERFYKPSVPENIWNYGFLTQKGGYNDGRWHLILAIYDSKKLTLIIDNDYVEYYFRNNLSEISVETEKTTQVTIAGNAQNNVPNYSGMLDQLRVYNRALSDTEIRLLYDEK